MHGSLLLLNRNMFEILSKLPRHGLGAQLTRTTWKEDSFWTITQVKLSPDGEHGKAYGVLTWRGREEPKESPRVIRGPLKRVWRQLVTTTTDGTESTQWPSLAASALQSEQAAAEAEAAVTPEVETAHESQLEAAAPSEEKTQ